MPDVGEELHGRRRERVVLGELQRGGEDAALKGGALGALDEALPVQQVVLGDGAGGDALGGVVCEGAVFLEQTPVRRRLGHGAQRDEAACGWRGLPLGAHGWVVCGVSTGLREGEGAGLGWDDAKRRTHCGGPQGARLAI